MKKEIYYWSPFIGRVATARSVVNSMLSLKRIRNNKFEVSLIDCFGEWNSFRSLLKKKKIKVFNLQKKINFSVDKYGFLYSRLVYFSTLLISYKRLKLLLTNQKPNFLIIHLLTYIPFLLYLNNSFKTKLILRISGKPKFNMFRILLWRLSNKNISYVFCPTLETIKYLKEKKIFDQNKIKFLPDPIISKTEIKSLKQKKVNLNFKLKKNSFFLCIGRLTKQKNHKLLISLYKNYKIKEKLIIIGEGELRKNLIKLIQKFKLEKKIILLNYQKNIFYYISRAKAVVIASLWEDPGFVMIESAFAKKPIICSDCPSGPKEFIGKNRGGFLFKSNSLISLIDTFDKFSKSNKTELNKKISYAKKKSNNYTIENHTKIIRGYLK